MTHRFGLVLILGTSLLVGCSDKAGSGAASTPGTTNAAAAAPGGNAKTAVAALDSAQRGVTAVARTAKKAKLDPKNKRGEQPNQIAI